MLLNLFYSYGYKYCFLPLFVACIYGKPFFLMKITPGSPFSAEKYKSPEALAAAKAKYNLDKPIMEQYVLYMSDLAHGDLGESMVHQGNTVWYYIKHGFPVTARLGVVAFILSVFGGISLTLNVFNITTRCRNIFFKC